MDNLPSFKENVFLRFIQWIGDLFQYRVPVYHFGIVTAIVGFAFWINQASIPQSPGPIEFSQEFADTTNVVANWQFIEKQAADNGITADTILTRILKSAL